MNRTAQLRVRTIVAVLLLCLGAASPARAQEQLLFPSRDNAQSAIIAKINSETVRIDIATWYLTDRLITNALIGRHSAGVRVRVIGDRVSIFEADAFTRREFEHLAANGVPIRVRYHPTNFPEIMHWKSGIFVGQGVVEFGSANWTSFELVPSSSTNFKDETVMFTGDPTLVSSFKSRFDQFWADTTYFLDWPAAYERETGQRWTVPMSIDRRRLEQNVTGPSTMIWEQGRVLNDRLAAEINAEASGVDLVIYRLTNAGITNALVNRRRAGVPVRVMVEPAQYRQIDWPEYWLTGARIDQLWAAGARIKQRAHEGLTHMKVVITSRYAMHGSSNFTNNWQRDHNYFIPADAKPNLHAAVRGEFDRMWNDTANYRDFYPAPPAIPAMGSPAANATGISTTPRLVWDRTPWAVAFDVYLGTATSGLTFRGRVNAVLTENPPATYSWTSSSALQAGTRYFWYVVARTFASDIDSSVVAASPVRSFVTAGSGPDTRTGAKAATPSDLDADGRSDPVVYRRSNGTWLAALSGPQYATSTSGQWGISTDVPVPGDYDADGRLDFAVYRPSDGSWYVLLSSSGYGSSLIKQWGIATDVPVPGDYDGDRRTDFAVFRPSEGLWYVLRSSTGYTSSLSVQWGAPGDRPIAADFDGDGKADIAVWRPSNGVWFLRHSSTAYQTSSMYQWGQGSLGDVPVAGDYDGDGRSDIAVWRPGNGVWFVRTSRTGYTSGFTAQWGAGELGDVPVVGDYDGDGRADLTVWRPGNGVWFVKKSSSNYTQDFFVQWGAVSYGDLPIR